MSELEEALEVFEQDLNLGLGSTKVMGRVLAAEVRRLQLELKALEDQRKNP